jgi:hypothetical protein
MHGTVGTIDSDPASFFHMMQDPDREIRILYQHLCILKPVASASSPIPYPTMSQSTILPQSKMRKPESTDRDSRLFESTAGQKVHGYGKNKTARVSLAGIPCSSRAAR